MAREAKIAGVEFLCYSCHVSCSEINIAQALPQNEL
jgi:DNA-binding sugar fermentation-stimulating protein